MKLNRASYIAGLATGAVAAVIGWVVVQINEPVSNLVVQYSASPMVLWHGPIEYLPFRDDPAYQDDLRKMLPQEYVVKIAATCRVTRYKLNTRDVAPGDTWGFYFLVVDDGALSEKQRSCLRGFEKFPYVQVYSEIGGKRVGDH